MDARFLAAIVGVIILVVLAQIFVLGGDDSSPSATNPSSIPTATPPVNQDAPVLLGQGDAGGGSSGGSTTSPESTYAVQSGDTLGAIASRLGVASEDQAAWVDEVLELNGMEDARQLQAGQELILPGETQAPASNDGANTQQDTPTPLATAPPSATGTALTPGPTAPSGGGAVGVYVVAEGDSPFLIALNHCVDDPDAWVIELLDINAVEATSLRIGQELDLPPGTPPFCGDEATEGSTPSP